MISSILSFFRGTDDNSVQSSETHGVELRDIDPRIGKIDTKECESDWDTTLNLYKEIDREEEREICEMLSEVNSKETGYYSSESDSFDNISANDIHVRDFDLTPMRVTTPRNIDSSDDEDVPDLTVRRNVVETAAEIYPAPDASSRNGLVERNVRVSTPVQGDQIRTVSGSVPFVLTKSAMKIEGQDFGATNIAFVPDTADDNWGKNRNIPENNDHENITAKKRWEMLRDVKVPLALQSNSKILRTNPDIAAKLTQSYKRAKKRVRAREISWVSVLRRIQLRKVSNAFRAFLDSHAASEAKHQFTRPKYYEYSESSSEYDSNDEDRDFYKHPRKKRWYRMRPKTGKEKLEQFKFYGKIGLFLKLYYMT